MLACHSTNTPIRDDDGYADDEEEEDDDDDDDDSCCCSAMLSTAECSSRAERPWY